MKNGIKSLVDVLHIIIYGLICKKKNHVHFQLNDFCLILTHNTYFKNIKKCSHSQITCKFNTKLLISCYYRDFIILEIHKMQTFLYEHFKSYFNKILP